MITDELRQAVCDAVAGALGDAYDRSRINSAWGCLVADDASRVADIAGAAINALAEELRDAARYKWLRDKAFLNSDSCEDDFTALSIKMAHCHGVEFDNLIDGIMGITVKKEGEAE